MDARRGALPGRPASRKPRPTHDAPDRPEEPARCTPASTSRSAPASSTRRARRSATRCRRWVSPASRTVRQGKVIDLELAETDAEAARAQVAEMCEKLLANTVIEDYRIEIG